MNLLKCFFISIVLLFVASCSQDNDISTPRNLQEYLDVNSSLENAEVIACAASDKTLITKSYVFYYPEEGATDIRYYETDSISQNKADFSLYKRKMLAQEPVSGGYLEKFIRIDENETWCLVTYKTDGKIHKSNPIKLKNNTKPTEWKDTVRIAYPQTLHPKFSWDDGQILENDIYFQIVTDADNTFLSGTYTTDKWFEYYNLDNVVLNITTNTPPALIKDDEYNFTLMGVSEDNWGEFGVRKNFYCRMIFKKNLLFLYDNQFVFSIKNSFKVRVKGAEKTTISFVKKLLNTIESQPLDSIVLQEDIVRLKRLPSIAHAYYQVFYSHNNLYTY